MEKRHFSKLDSYSLMIIALSALIVSVWQVNQQQKHDRISVRPYLDWSQTMDEEGYIMIDLKNKGFGPAFFEKGQLVVDGQRFKDWKQGLMVADSAITVKRSTSLGKFTLLPGEVIHLVAAKGGKKNIDITYEVHFEDAYGQQFNDYMQYIGQPF